MTSPLPPETVALIEALQAVNSNVPQVCRDLTEGRFTPGRQVVFADLLEDLAKVIRTHAFERHGNPGSSMPPP